MAGLNMMLIPDAQLWHDDRWHAVVKNQDGALVWSQGEAGYETFVEALGAAQAAVGMIAYTMRHQLSFSFAVEAA